MNFLGYPIETWIATTIAIIIKLKASRALTLFGAISTTVVGVGSGMLLYKPITSILGLADSWEIMIAILTALTFENLTKLIVEESSDTETIKGWINFFITKRKEK